MPRCKNLNTTRRASYITRAIAVAIIYQPLAAVESPQPLGTESLPLAQPPVADSALAQSSADGAASAQSPVAGASSLAQSPRAPSLVSPAVSVGKEMSVNTLKSQGGLLTSRVPAPSIARITGIAPASTVGALDSGVGAAGRSVTL